MELYFLYPIYHHDVLLSHSLLLRWNLPTTEPQEIEIFYVAVGPFSYMYLTLDPRDSGPSGLCNIFR